MTHRDSEEFSEIMKKLFEKANEDGIVSAEEEAIISRAKIDLEKYVHMVEKAKEDGIIDLGESKQLEEFKHRILSNAGIIAAKDFKVTQDEKLLIKRLAELLTEQ